MNLVFVYGTLLPGARNAALLEGVKCLGETAVSNLSLYVVPDPEFCYPAAVPGHGTVKGLAYAISDDKLKELDAHESVPSDFRRELYPSPIGKLWVYLYERPSTVRERIASGDWREWAHLNVGRA